MTEKKIKERRYGITEWDQYSHCKPPYGKQLILCVLEDGYGRFIPDAMYRLDDKFAEIKSSRKSKTGNNVRLITKENIIDPKECDDIAWAEVTQPDWWYPAEDGKEKDVQ